MKLIVGLGNFGAQYKGSRHNIGFAAVEALAERAGLEWHMKDRFKATVAEGEVFDTNDVMLVMPQTYYNASGEAVQAIKAFYKLQNSDILVIHDELDLPFGTIRARVGGTDAGNNGIKSVIAHIGADFTRIRVGIAPEGGKANAEHVDYVLGHFSHEENTQMGEVIGTINDLVAAFLDVRKKFEHTSIRIG